MADAAVSVVVNKLFELASEEVLLQVKVRNDIKVLHDKLEWLQTSLKDADQKRRGSTNQFIPVWVRQTRDLAFNIEDTLDEFVMTKVKKGSMPEHGWKTMLKFQWLKDFFVQVWVTHKLTNKIATIRARLEELDTHKETYKIEIDSSSLWWTPSFSKTFPTWDRDLEEPAIGLGAEVEKLTKQLLDDKKERRVISILGESGVKTLLAKKVYESKEIKNGFEIVAWKSLPRKFRIKDAFKDIYHKVSSQIDQNDLKETDEDFHTIIVELLNERKYLLVLDGIVSRADWMHISAFLPNKQKGSRVLLIPHPNSEVASLTNSEIIPFRPDFLLNNENIRELFVHRFFDKKSWPVKIGDHVRNVHQVTGGHPLNSVLLAGVLQTKDSSSEWDRVFAHLKAEKEAVPIERMLQLSFDDLPHQLKSCFMYFAAIPENTNFPTDRLVRLWIAEGFIQPKPSRTLEEIGEGYLKELSARSLIRIYEKDEFDGGTVVSVDDLLHSFLQSEAQDSSFVEIHDNANLVSSGSVRRLSIQNYIDKRLEVENSLPKLRTLLCDCVEKDCEPHTLKFLLGSKFLRVLDLHGLIINRFPNGIGDLVHLRYFRICCKRLKRLPSSVSKLLNLQTLDIQETSVRKLSKSFWRNSSLRHVLADNLELPKHIGNLNNLQTLQRANCTNWNQKNVLLEKMTNIRILDLEELSKAQTIVIVKSLQDLEFLKQLRLKVKDGHSLPSGIFGTASLRSLQIMELHGQLDNLDDVERNGFRANLPSLISLTLEMSGVNQDFINMLAELPCLANLFLRQSYNDTTLEFLPGGFQNLTKLYLENLPDLRKLRKITTTTMPNLRQLTLWGCLKLTKLPRGFKMLKELKEVRIHNMKELVKKIRDKTGSDFEKIKDVPVVVTKL